MGPFRFAKHRLYKKLQKLAASFPETTEVETWEHPTFRVRNKIFASFGAQDDEPTIGVKSTLATQSALTAGEGFFVPKYVGKHGWIGILPEKVDWPVIEELVEESYRMVAPKTLVKKLDAS